MSTRVLGGLVAAIILAAVGWWLLEAMRSDESRILGHLRYLATCFEEGQGRAFAEGLTDDYHDENHGFPPEQIRAILLRTKLDPTYRNEAGRFRFRAHVVGESAEFEWPTEDRAEVRVRIVVEENSSGDEWRESWVARFELTYRLTDDGWKIARSRYKTETGRRPL